jgi:hypothetical protein
VFHDPRDAGVIMSELYDELYRFVDYDSEDAHILSSVGYNPAEHTPNGLGYSDLAALWAEKGIHNYGIQWETWIAMTPGRRAEFMDGINRGVRNSAASQAAAKAAEDLRRQEEALRRTAEQGGK